MEWILVLIIAYGDSQIGRALVVTNIPGHKSLQACLATLENAKRERVAQGLPKLELDAVFHRSFCVEKGR
jgi:hypothetical protein